MASFLAMGKREAEKTEEEKPKGKVELWDKCTQKGGSVKLVTWVGLGNGYAYTLADSFEKTRLKINSKTWTIIAPKVCSETLISDAALVLLYIFGDCLNNT